MKARTIALMSVMAAATVVAQTAPPSQKVAPNTKPAVATPAKPAAAQQTPPRAGQAEAAMRKKLASRPVVVARKPAPTTRAKSAAEAKPPAAAVKKAAVRASAKPPGKRDPFLSPIKEGGPMGPACTTGKKCLAINSIVLRGIVKSQVGMIAVVESSARRISYFLRENDPVFNGYVVKITGDTVVFRENVMDKVGKQSTRDVVMKVVAPVV